MFLKHHYIVAPNLVIAGLTRNLISPPNPVIALHYIVAPNPVIADLTRNLHVIADSPQMRFRVKHGMTTEGYGMTTEGYGMTAVVYGIALFFRIVE